MTPDTRNALRSLFCLRDMLVVDDAETPFKIAVAMVAWDCREKSRPIAENDQILEILRDASTAQNALLLFLASIDRNFLRLAQRLAARTLVRDTNRPLTLAQRHIFAHLMTAEEPEGRKTTLARNVVLVATIAQTLQFGWHPTESGGHAKTGKTPSTCRRFSEDLQRDFGVGVVTYDAIEDVWKPRKREAVLLAAGFPQNEVSEFLRLSSPMI